MLRLRVVYGFLTLSLLIAVTAIATVEVSAQKVRLRSRVNPNCAGASANLRYSDIYADGNIAVQGSYTCHGVFIYDVSDPDAAKLASVYDPIPNQAFLEAIVVGNRGYFGSGGTSPGSPSTGDGVHIVDLSNPSQPVVLGKVNASKGNGFNAVHEMMVWNNYLIENYNSFSDSTIKFIDVSNAAAPVFKWNLTPTDAWVHAMHIRGNRMYLSGWGGRIEIYDLSNIANQPPLLIGTIFGNSTNHSAWTSEDGGYLYSARETLDGDIRVYDVRNPSQPLLVRAIKTTDLGLNAVSPHNPVVMGNYLYVSWYQAGTQVFDINDPTNPQRVGQYDTYGQAFAPPAEELQRLTSSDPWDQVCGAARTQNGIPSSFEGNWAVYPFLGQNKVIAGDMATGLYVLDATGVSAPLKNRVSDFDGDRKTDLAVFKRANGQWRMSFSGSSTLVFSTFFGVDGDLMTPGDYNGDGRTELGVFRPSNGHWYVQQGAGYYAVQFGQNGDVPVAADYDADGKTDIAVFRPSNGTWYIWQSTLGIKAVQWGMAGDKPVTGDFEGDGKSDVAVWRPAVGVWYVLQSSSNQGMYAGWGLPGDKPLSGDFDGNGRADFAVYRPSEGIWYIYDPTATPAVRGFTFGVSDDMPIPSDFDGDGKTDVAVFRPATDQWFWIDSSTNNSTVRVFGDLGDVPAASSVQPQ
jgi:hypothetical protein